jgi:hypothetical protein
MKKFIKYLLLLLLIVIVGYKSVYLKKLSAVKDTSAGIFDAIAFTQKLWDERLPSKLDSAMDLNDLISAIRANPGEAFLNYTNALGIGNYRYGLVKLTGVASLINEDDIVMEVTNADTVMKVKLATEYVYGNAIRDASKLVDIRDFTNTTDLNNVSEQLNSKVRNSILPPFRKLVKQGDTIEATGAIEFNKEHIRFNDLELIPVRLKILP